MLDLRYFLFAAVMSSTCLVAQAAEPRIRDSRTISVLPQTSAEIKLLHDRAKGFAAELLPADEPYEIKSFVPFLTKRDEIEAKSRLPNTCSRRHAFSVGLEMLTDDQKQLPVLSGNQILTYLKAHFVSVQARIYREPVSRELYLGPRCLAATQTFQKGNLTEEFSPTVAESVNNIRSLGLLLKAKTPPTAANLRTLVLVHKNELSQGTSAVVAAKTNYEYLFIRGVEAGPDRLELHAFATSDERTKLHWLMPAQLPTAPSNCSVRGAVHFTEYSMQGLYPKTAVIRRSLITGQLSIPWDALDIYAHKTLGRPAFECITEILDAIISGDLRDTDSSDLSSQLRRDVREQQQR